MKHKSKHRTSKVKMLNGRIDEVKIIKGLAKWAKTTTLQDDVYYPMQTKAPNGQEIPSQFGWVWSNNRWQNIQLIIRQGMAKVYLNGLEIITTEEMKRQKRSAAAKDAFKIIVANSPPQGPPCPKCASKLVAMCEGQGTVFSDMDPAPKYQEHPPHLKCLECGYPECGVRMET